LENHNIDDPLKEAYLRNQSGFGRDRCARLLENLCNKGVVASVQYQDERTFNREVTGYYLVDGGGLVGSAGVLLVANQQNKTLLFSSRNIEKLSSYVGYVGDFIRQFNINRKRDQISPLASPLVHSTSRTNKTPLPLLLESCRSGTSKTPARPTQPPSKQDFVATFGESILHEIVGFTYKGDCEKEDLVRVYGPSIIETMLKYKFLTGKKILKLNSKISW
jgi:hypothetical protein